VPRFLRVLRQPPVEQADQFYATVFLASGLLFVASLFAGIVATSTPIEAVVFGGIDGDTYYAGRSMSGCSFLNIFAMKMAGVSFSDLRDRVGGRRTSLALPWLYN
jgi:hypothetical protein